MTDSSPERLAVGYFDAWSGDDVDSLRPLLADDVTFSGPLAQIAGADEYVSSITGLFHATSDLTIEHRWVDGSDVLTWFLLTVGDAAPTPVASWIHTAGGRISSVRVTFDPRGMT